MLRAMLSFAESAPMPEASVLRNWAREAEERLERAEPLLPPQGARRNSDGRLEVVGWKGDPSG